jgi:hypothetical protein
VEVWSHEGTLYEVNSFYCLPEDAWHYELTGFCGAAGTGSHITVAIPDGSPEDGPFTPQPAGLAVVHFGGGQAPWPILRRFLDLVESSGDLVDSQPAPAESIELPLSNNVRWHDGRRFEANSFHLGDDGAWCYELYEVNAQAHSNDYIEVRVPDASPGSGPFIPEPAACVTLTAHGEWTLPWPVFQRFVDAIEASGDIVNEQPGPDGQVRERP